MPPDQIALFPPTLFDTISTDLLLASDPEAGNDLLAYYTVGCSEKSALLYVQLREILQKPYPKQ